MPSNKIIPACAQIVQNQIQPSIPARWRSQYRFGIQALTCRPFVSLASNARQTVPHPDTASTKMDRLVGNAGLASALGAAACNLGFVTPRSLVNCDHSQFGGLLAFVGAVQTGKGRAIPCLVNTTYWAGLPAHEDAPKSRQRMRAAYKALDYGLYDQVRTTLDEFARRLGFWPRLVFDRGFGGEALIRFLFQHEAIFYIRLKASRLVDLGGQKLRVDQLLANDMTVILKGMRLRVVRSDEPVTGEPWYILTSDMAKGRAKILRIYYHRFEIEETFKDLKHILDLDLTKLMKPLSLKVLLWFASLGFILVHLASHCHPRYGQPRHPKKRISWYRQFVEALQRQAYAQMTDLITGRL
jgi:hypothetical protein